MKKEWLETYAKLIIEKGVHVLQNQEVLLEGSIEAISFIHELTKQAYKAGASKVSVVYEDETLNCLDFKYQSKETLSEIPQYQVDQKNSILNAGGCLIYVLSPTPDSRKNLDALKIAVASKAHSLAFKDANDIVMANKTQWCVVGYPNNAWAQKVFQSDTNEVAYDKLCNSILESVYVNDKDDARAYWDQHNQRLQTNIRQLNKHRFQTLHFTNSLGTDLYVDLIHDHVWAGGAEITSKGIEFHPNMPTEEVFTMPYKFGVHGKVVSSKPLDYQGVSIPHFELNFKAGKVVSYYASEHEEVLKNLLDSDEGSCYLGEVALVPFHSPISAQNILYYETLYDENASCHLALGAAYPTNVLHGEDMSVEERTLIGVNDSLVHVDFMFGTSDMEVVGILSLQQELLVMQNGDFVE